MNTDYYDNLAISGIKLFEKEVTFFMDHSIYSLHMYT